ncbi:hypothetical protein [Massilia niabensis]|uniref:Uncharacterized protein n=1 Tax=Massilia niabensis TaxID=544910 RepID=A0ABW0L496_9BURK
MTPAAQFACTPILEKLNSKVRRGVIQRVEAMVRELDFLVQREDRYLSLLKSAGWKDHHFHVIFFLNSFYQRVLGPQKSAAREGPEGLGTFVPIHHGSVVFDRRSAQQVNAAERNFNTMNQQLNVSVHWLHANTCRDLIYLMAGVALDERPVDQ